MLLLIDRAGITGGAERFVTGLAIHLPRDRIEPWVCSTRQGHPDAVAVLREAGVVHVDLGRRGKPDLRRLLQLSTLLRRERFDVLHSHMFGSNVWGAVFGPACHVPVVIAHEHNWSYEGHPLRMWLDGNVIGRLVTQFVAVSEANRTRMVELEGIALDKIRVLPTAYIPSIGSDGDVRAELGLDPGTPLIGTASILRPEKALHTLVRAHAQLAERIPDLHLVIAGDGPCRPELEAEAAQLGTGRVHFLGARTDVDAILRALDVGVMSSEWEGMPLFVFECMAARTPLVATAVGGLLEVVRDGETGRLVPPNSPTALAAAVADLILNPDRGQTMAAAAAERLPEFSIKRVAERFADLYQDLWEGQQ